MKRGFVNSHHSNGSLDNSNANRKYQSLLEDYLELQKEYVSRKRKIQTVRQKRDTLVDEVGFLKQRHEHLTNLQFSEVGPKPGLHQNADINVPNVPVRKQTNNIVIEQTDIEQKSRGKEDHAWKAREQP